MQTIDTQPIREQIAATDADIKNPLPTPPVGTTVVWYDRASNEPGAEIAAIVTRIEGPGKISVTTFRPQGMPEFTRRGVLYMTHPQHENRHNTVSRNSGSWAYPGQSKPPKADFELHLTQLASKRESLVAKLDEAESIKAETAKAAG